MISKKKKREFISNLSRQSCLNAISAHIKREGSVVITGDYGCGKTELLKQITQPSAVRVRSLGSLYQLLGNMVGVQDASPRDKEAYLNRLCDHPRIIIIDEAQHLIDRVYPYLKIIMDAGCSVILSGLPDLHDTLRHRHPDVLSRMTHLKLEPLGVLELKKVLPDFEADAVDVLHGSVTNMREMMNIADNCRDYAVSKGMRMVTVDSVLLFIGE